MSLNSHNHKNYRNFLYGPDKIDLEEPSTSRSKPRPSLLLCHKDSTDDSVDNSKVSPSGSAKSSSSVLEFLLCTKYRSQKQREEAKRLEQEQLEQELKPKLDKHISFSENTKKHNGKRANADYYKRSDESYRIKKKKCLPGRAERFESYNYHEIGDGQSNKDEDLDAADIPTTSSESLFVKRTYQLNNNETYWQVFKKTGERKDSVSTQNTDFSHNQISVANISPKISKLLKNSKVVSGNDQRGYLHKCNSLSKYKCRGYYNQDFLVSSDDNLSETKDEQDQNNQISVLTNAVGEINIGSQEEKKKPINLNVVAGEIPTVLNHIDITSKDGTYRLRVPLSLIYKGFHYNLGAPADQSELPSYGHKQWQAHFGRTFDIYSKLWKFQQQHRSILDSRYGLKRWQIGEIASKIGQLYYHFYLRTSDTTYLVEAYSFYSAIRGRRYYTLASKEAKCELMVKKLRYYARFIVVAILLQQPVTIDELLSELDQQIIAYGNAYDPNDQLEWINVLEEVRAFLVAEPGITIVDPDNKNRVVTVSGRLSQASVPPIERTTQMGLMLHDALIIGSGTQLVKFSELTIDMFRMVQNLEWEIDVPIRDPSGDSPQNRGLGAISKHATTRPGIEGDARSLNPHKYLLFKPSARQVLIYLASSCNDLPPNCALLIYISADGHHPQQNTHPEDYSYDIGGLITTSKSDIYREYNRETKSNTNKYKDKHILYPGDLHPFTRRPLFIIVDSDNSYAFQHIPKLFGQPLVVFMSPLSLPVTLSDRKNQGSLFTLFLHNPIAGICNVCDVFTVSISTWDSCVHLRDRFMAEVMRLLMKIRLDPMYYPFLGDEFLRLMILRYTFCESVLRLHRSFRARTNLPRAYPPLPDDLFEHRDLVPIILQMADCLGVRSVFYDTSAPGPPSRD